MANLRTSNELHYTQSFDIDPEKQIYEIVRVPEEKILDISSFKWKSEISKKFLVYMDKKAFYFSIIQENEIIFDETIFIDLEKRDNTKFYFELYSESKILLICVLVVC